MSGGISTGLDATPPGKASGGRGEPDAASPVSPSFGGDFFGAAIQPALISACEDRLSAIQWFRTDWQRGGALTGYATYAAATGPCHVVVKLPVPPQELLWLEQLQPHRHTCGQIVPHLLASGRDVGGYDFAWVVMQRLMHGPLDTRWKGGEFDLLIDTAGRFYEACSGYPVDQAARDEEWPAVIDRSRTAVRQFQIEDGQRWNLALRGVQKKLPRILEVWNSHASRQWCHGDLHLGNAMTDTVPPSGPAVLFDLAKVHVGHWVEDAVYLEHLYWSRPERLAGCNLLKMMAHRRRDHALKNDDWPALANIRRTLLAAAAPLQQAQQQNRPFLHAALTKLEQILPSIG